MKRPDLVDDFMQNGSNITMTWPAARKYIAALEAEVARLRDAARWIPVKECPSENRKTVEVTVTLEDGRRFVTLGEYQDDYEEWEWFDEDDGSIMCSQGWEVTHYRPLPEVQP